MGSQRLLYSEIDKPQIVKLDKSIKRLDEKGGYNGLITHGLQNDYPQLIEAAVQKSTTGKSVVKIVSRFLVAQGFENEAINNIVIGHDERGKEITVKSLLRNIVYDIILNNGFYVHTNWNLEQRIKDYTYLPFKNCRFSKPDDTGFSAKVLTYDNWTKEKGWKKYDKKEIQDYSTFTTDKATFENQIKVQTNGDISKYKGQVYFNFLENNFFYPVSPFDETFLNLDTEYQISIFKNRTVRSGFLGKVAMRVSPPTSEDERAEFIAQAKDFTGVDGAQFFLIEDNTLNSEGEIQSGAAAMFEKIDTNIDPDLFENWVSDLQTAIRLSWNVPQIFIDYDAGKLGATSGETIIQATNYYNKITKDVRNFISESFAELFKFSANEILSTNTNWNIKEINLYENGTTNISTTARN